MSCENNEIFKMVFNSDGEFLHVENADGEKAKEVTSVEEINEKKYSLCSDGRKELASIKDLMVLKKRDVSMQLLDVPGHSVCFLVLNNRVMRLWC